MFFDQLLVVSSPGCLFELNFSSDLTRERWSSFRSLLIFAGVLSKLFDLPVQLFVERGLGVELESLQVVLVNV